ncbi:hypothetical protein RT723_10710 [Psychrosphaera aquimarina]|uniref:Uncharacterized protein n=1 Tax=Psychrosphaera aquimarina TaxID=2044854 RepID=A0ABU3R1P3_9GAMM|nr:hypothetical protein [Psychrosphaera aquimarina]MDU0113459.1 hypothetical protein [Psychrosphaera aquimarina]
MNIKLLLLFFLTVNEAYAKFHISDPVLIINENSVSVWPDNYKKPDRYISLMYQQGQENTSGSLIAKLDIDVYGKVQKCQTLYKDDEDFDLDIIEGTCRKWRFDLSTFTDTTLPNSFIFGLNFGTKKMKLPAEALSKAKEVMKTLPIADSSYVEQAERLSLTPPRGVQDNRTIFGVFVDGIKDDYTEDVIEYLTKTYYSRSRDVYNCTDNIPCNLKLYTRDEKQVAEYLISNDLFYRVEEGDNNSGAITKQNFSAFRVVAYHLSRNNKTIIKYFLTPYFHSFLQRMYVAFSMGYARSCLQDKDIYHYVEKYKKTTRRALTGTIISSQIYTSHDFKIDRAFKQKILSNYLDYVPLKDIAMGMKPVSIGLFFKDENIGCDSAEVKKS